MFDINNNNNNYNCVQGEIQYRQGDIVYCDLGDGEEHEQDGVRPCIIIQNDVGNKYSPTTIIAPISKSIKPKKNGKMQPTQFVIENYLEVGLKERSVVLFEQVRAISKKRIKDDRPKGSLDFMKVAENLLTSFGFDIQILLKLAQFMERSE